MSGPAPSGRTYWWGKDCAWWRRERIVMLGQEFGSAGPAVIDWLSCEAKLQDDGGWVKSGKLSVAHGAFVDAVTVGHVLSRAVAIGALDDYEETDGRFTCRISGWKADQDRARAAVRKAAQRAAEKVEQGSTEPDPPNEPPVTDRDTVTPGHAETPTEQNRTEEKKEKQRETPTSIRYQGKTVPPEIVTAAQAALEEFNAAAGRQVGATTTSGQPSPSLKQIIGAMLARPDVPPHQWVRAIKNTIANPPKWIDGPIQLGHIFGDKAAEHALENPGTGTGTGTGNTSGQLDDRRAWARQHLPELPEDYVVTMLGFQSATPLADLVPDDIEAGMRSQWPHLFEEVAA